MKPNRIDEVIDLLDQAQATDNNEEAMFLTDQAIAVLQEQRDIIPMMSVDREDVAEQLERMFDISYEEAHRRANLLTHDDLRQLADYMVDNEILWETWAYSLEYHLEQLHPELMGE